MKPTFLICFLLGWHTLAFCQTGKVTGSVMDAETKTPLELATVTILGQDSSVIAYQLSDKNGLFTIEKLPLTKKLLVSVSYTGYIGYKTSVQLQSARADTLAVFLALNSKDTVVVTAAIPIRMNGDTLEINPAAFKMKNDAVVEELLNQVPGITIWSDGTITVNGKRVQNLLVDGKPFMGSSDTRVATQNLPKSVIDKIQLYQEYDRSKIGQDSQPQDSLLTMNLKLKEGSKKGYFGKAGAGYGSMDRFESDLSFQMYNKKTSAGIGGGLNNINKNIGNLQEMFQNNTYRNYNPNLYNVGKFGTNGINRNHSIGAVFVHNFIESANSRQNDRITINYNKSGTNTYITDMSVQNRTAIDNPQFILDQGGQNSRRDKHDLGIKYIKTNSYDDNFDVNGKVNTSNESGSSYSTVEVRDSANRLQSTNGTTSLQSSKSDNESLSVNFSTSKEEDPLKNVRAQVFVSRGSTTSEKDVISEFESFTNGGKNTFNNRRYATNNQSLNINGSLDYSGFKRMLLGRYNLFGINLSLSQWFNYTRTSNNVMVSDYDSTAKSYMVNSKLSNENKREVFEYSPILTMSKSIYKYTDVFYRSLYMTVKLMDDLKTDKNTSSFAKRNLDRSFEFFRYEGNLSYQYTKREKYRYSASVYYAKRFAYPSIDQLYTLVDDINAYDIRVGNPYLKNSIDHSVSLNANFNTESPKSLYSINSGINGSYNFSLNPVTDSIVNDVSG
ncbi:MAG TPA: carboxypeptidase regulatory-like domain-containing protein, partial [Niastella sp.]